jgi:DNA repair exonuclease SbcCD ATPase subunit
MPAPTDHTHHIRIRSTQLEMPSADLGGRSGGDDYDRKLQAAHEELERLKQESENLLRKKQELEELTARKRAFVSQQVELTERLSAAITLIDRGLFEIRNETNDLEQCRVCFASHLEKIEKINPENWTRENLSEKLERASMIVELAADEYDQAAAHFEGTRSDAIFGRAGKSGRTGRMAGVHGEFTANLRNGFAFNLPVIVLGSVALLIYLLK